jgi:hypothetical protein
MHFAADKKGILRYISLLKKKMYNLQLLVFDISYWIKILLTVMFLFFFLLYRTTKLIQKYSGKKW